MTHPTHSTHCGLQRRSFLARSATGLVLTGAALIGQAQTAPPAAPAPAGTELAIGWRQTSVLIERQASVQTRRGVAIFSNGEPATIAVRLQPTSRPVDGRMSVQNEMRFRFEDGSSFLLRGTTLARVSPEGMPIPGETTGSGEFAEGTGRFTGITGTWQMRVRTDLTTQADGVLGDYFADGTGRYTLAR